MSAQQPRDHNTGLPPSVITRSSRSGAGDDAHGVHVSSNRRRPEVPEPIDWPRWVTLTPARRPS